VEGEKMADVQFVEVDSTSASSAEVSPMVIRDGERTRLVFIPTLVNNQRDSSAPVKGIFAYQRKKASDEWERVDSINLAALKSGEGVRLELKGVEVARLYGYLNALLDHYEHEGIIAGREKYMLLELDGSLPGLLERFGSDVDPEVLKVMLGWFAKQDERVLAEFFTMSPTESLVKLDSALGVTRLERFLSEAEPLLESDDEMAWQRLLERESWVVSQVFSYPVVIIDGEAYVGGKDRTNSGGNVADFLYRSSTSDNCLLVEIKTPMTPLLASKRYRNRIYDVHAELSGAAQQLRQNAYSISRSYDSLRGDGDVEFRIFSPQMLLIIGNTASLTDQEQKKSFELYRQSLRDVDVIAFDELVEKVRLLLTVLKAE
jgi:hypothetical protein